MANYDNQSVVTASTIGSSTLRDSSINGFSKIEKDRILKVFVRLYVQKDQWTKYGKLKPYCNGNIIIAPVNLWWWLAEIFVIPTVILFTYQLFFLNWLIVVPAIVMALLEWMAFYKTCLKDPGAMPKPSFVTAFRNLIKVLSSSLDQGRRAAITRTLVHSNGATEQLNFCWRCYNFRSATTSHCGPCDCCMIQHDHHCPVFGGCVAKNNLNSFHTMIISMGCFWIYVIGYCIFKIAAAEPYETKKDFWDTSEGDYKFGTRVTLYLIIAEVAACAVVPLITACITNIFFKPKNPQNEMLSSTARLAGLKEELIGFAQDNDIPTEDEILLRQLLLPGDDAESELQDLNHNQFFCSKAQGANVS